MDRGIANDRRPIAPITAEKIAQCFQKESCLRLTANTNAAAINEKNSSLP
jgi:hypothetical protein